MNETFKHLFSLFTQAFGFTLKIQQRPAVDSSHLPEHIHPVIRQIYAHRGINHAADIKRSTKELLHYQQLRGVNQAVELLHQSMLAKKQIMIVGDFDADGATSTAVMMRAMTMMGNANHRYLVPNRFEFGYGLSPEIVNMAIQAGAEVIITVDSGINCHAGVERAKSAGLQVIITDHHLPGKIMPVADAIVNPNQPECEFASKSLAGVGVAFYLMSALRRYLQAQDWFMQQNIPEPNLASLLDLVALGTVADVVPLDSNNRIFVHQGVQRIRAGKCCAGITALLRIAKRTQQDIDASTMGFVLGPRLNAAGRLDDMSLGIQCLLSDKPEDAIGFAIKLDELNAERKEIESGMQKEAEAVLQNLTALQDPSGTDTSQSMPHGIALYDETWHQGVIGIVAGRVKDKYYRPTIVFAEQDDDTLKGSARSIPGLHIRDLLEELHNRYPDMILKFGGHAAAAGLAIPKAQFPAFESAFASLCQEWLAEHELQDYVLSDGNLPDNCANIDFAEQLKAAGPWGQSFPEPVFDDQFRVINRKVLHGKHLKVVLQSKQGQLLDGILFNAESNLLTQPLEYVHAAYQLDINKFRGNVSLQLMIRSLSPA